MTELIIGVAGWIIQDGNYKDFAVGEQREFALEYHPKSVLPCAPSNPSMEHISEGLYQATTCRVWNNARAIVYDFGYVCAYDMLWKDKYGVHCPNHPWMAGQFYLGIDPYFYKDGLKKTEGIPNLSYQWQIERIQLETTPYIKSEGGTLPNGQKRKVFTRDTTKISYKDLKATNAWYDDTPNCRWWSNASNCYLLTIKMV